MTAPSALLGINPAGKIAKLLPHFLSEEGERMGAGLTLLHAALGQLEERLMDERCRPGPVEARPARQEHVARSQALS